MSLLEVARHGDVEVWYLNRPQVRNALAPALVTELGGALDSAEDRHVRTVVLAGNGRSFCAGADLSYLLECARTGQSPRPFLSAICELTVAMESSPIVFIAALHGHAVAGGMELALSCDVVIAAAGTLVGDGHVRNNLVPGGGASVRLPLKLGIPTASWLGLSGELVAIEALVGTGWVQSVVPLEQVVHTAQDIAQRLAAVPAGAQQRFKSLLQDDPKITRERLERELDTFDAHWSASDIEASLGAFLTKPKELDHA